MKIQIQTVNNEARVDSRDIAEVLGNQHRNVVALIEDYRGDFESFSRVAFQTEAQKTAGGTQQVKFALLNEDQCYFLLTLVRNSDQVVPLKRGLVQAFKAARDLLAAPTLPSDPLELLALSLAGLQQHRAQLTAIETRLNTAPIRTDSQMRARIYAACQQFARVHPKSYSGAYRAFKEAFGFSGAPLAAYDDLPQNRLDEALSWLDMQTRTFAVQRPLLEG